MRQQSIRTILNPKVISVCPDTPLPEAVALMENNRISCLVVLKDKRPVGIFTERDLVFLANRGGRFNGSLIRDVMSRSVITVGADINLYEGYVLLESNKIRHLVVVDCNEEIAGVVTQTDIINNLGFEYFIELKSISKIMTKNVVTVKKWLSVREVISVMADRSISCVVVEDRAYPVGILTERDVVRLFRSGVDVCALKIEEVMSRPVKSVYPDITVNEAADIMTREKIRRLVVTDETGRTFGLITQYDIIKNFEIKYIEFLKEVIREKERVLIEHKKDYNTEAVLNYLLGLSLEDMSLEDILERSLDLILSIPWLSFGSRGGIFLTEEGQDVLVLKAHRELPRQTLEICSRIVFGTCLCGRAALNRKIEFAGRLDERHGVRYEGMEPHGHYCVPVLYADKLLGVINIHLKEGHCRNQKEDVFLTSVANALAGVIMRKQMEAELLNAKKLESLGILAGGVAHDFNNILTGVLGNISFAKRFVNPEDRIFDMLEKAEKASERAKALTYQLLTLAKGREPVRKIISLAALLKNAADFALCGSNIKCEFFLADDLYPTEADEGQLERVIHNLVINARDAMPGGGALRIYAENVADNDAELHSSKDGRSIKITIEDHGTGIDEEHLQKIFDPYFTTKERDAQKGVGLGLAVCYAIIKKHNGSITVKTEKGVGTKVHICLPALDRKLQPSDKSEEAPVAGKGTVLVMDDEQLVRDFAATILEHLGYKVRTAEDGDEALNLYKKAMADGAPFDAVVMDLTIPGGKGGRETISLLLEADPGVKAIVSSGYSGNSMLSDFGKYGFSGVIEKPYTLLQFSRVLHGVINGVQQAGPHGTGAIESVSFNSQNSQLM